MTNVEMLTRALMADPDDLVAMGVLWDALQEEQDMTHTEAQARVDRVRQTALDVRDCNAAADLLSSKSTCREELLHAIRAHAGYGFFGVGDVVLIGGESEPCFMATTPGSRQEAPESWKVKVGARWVLKFHRENPSLWPRGLRWQSNSEGRRK